MKRHSVAFTHCVLASSLLSVIGCGQGPSRVEAPSLSPSRAGNLAIEEYDTDGDGYVGGGELDNAPSLKAALATLDSDSDGKVSADEVAERVQSWQNQKTGIMTVKCMVKLDGRPLEGAEVVFEPEAFLGSDIQAGSGTTNRFGIATPVIPKEKRPTPDTPPGLALGLYKVRITKGGEIPSRYNSETVLGQQLSSDELSLQNNSVQFDLESK
jgi:hypothetical protein